MTIKPPDSNPLGKLCIVILAITLTCAYANASPTPASGANGDAALTQQVAELQAKTKQLEAALAAKSPPPAASPTMSMSSQRTPAPAIPAMTPGEMGMMGDKGGMPMNPQDEKPMPGGGMGGMMTGMIESDDGDGSDDCSVPGYAHVTTCDSPICLARISRSLAFVSHQQHGIFPGTRSAHRPLNRSASDVDEDEGERPHREDQLGRTDRAGRTGVERADIMGSAGWSKDRSEGARD